MHGSSPTARPALPPTRRVAPRSTSSTARHGGHGSDDDAQLVPPDVSSSHTEGVVATTLSELVEGEPVGVVEQGPNGLDAGARPARARSCTGRGRAHRRESRGGLESTSRPRSLWSPPAQEGARRLRRRVRSSRIRFPRLRVTVWPTWGRTAASAGCVEQSRIGLADGRADPHRAVVARHVVEPRYAVHVDEKRRTQHPHVQRRHEALPAGEDLRFVASRRPASSTLRRATRDARTRTVLASLLE